jgi:integrase
MPKLTKTIVENEQPSDKERFVWDTETKGFGVKIFPTGIKSFIFQYRTREGNSKRLTIGKLSDTLTVDQARKIATEKLREVLNGKDPQAEKKARREVPTLAQVFADYQLAEAFTEKAATTRASDLGRINRHLVPLLGNVHADMLTTNDVKRAVKAITEGQTAISEKTKARGFARVEGGAGTARKAFHLLRAVCKWSTKEGTPAGTAVDWTHVRTAQDGQRDAIIETSADYARLFDTLQQMQDEKRIRSAVADAIRVIAMTGARRGEVAGMRWRHVDLRAGTVTLALTEHKTGRRTGKAKVISLPAAAQTIIQRQPAGEPDDFVFRPCKGEGAISLNKPWRDIRAEAGLPADLGLHGLRHSVASHLAMAGASTAELMAQMGHKQATTTARYVHFAENARSTLAERAASMAVAGMNATQEKAEDTPTEQVK